MTHDAATIAAFVDGELDDLTIRRIEREAASDPVLAAEIARHRALKAQLTAHYAPIIDEPVPDRLSALLTATPTVDTSLADRRAVKTARFAPIHWGTIAAALVLGLTVGLRPWGPMPDVASEKGVLVAAGPLAAALDSQLASNQPAAAPVRIGLSFRDQGGRYCRSFEKDGMGGIGCRSDRGWQLERTVGGGTRGDYRQAGSSGLAAAAADMMAGDPLDAAGERAARDKGWAR